MGGIGAAIAGLVANYLVVVAPDAALPEDLAARHAEVLGLAKSDKARAAADRFRDAGVAALRGEDADAARQAIENLENVRRILDQEYTVRIVNRPGEQSGVWRIPDVNSAARNHYVIVEAVDPTGKRLAVPIANEETGKTQTVQTWGIRVSEKTFESVAEDKRDNGIIERDRFGYKRRGNLVPKYEVPTPGGAITRW